LITSRKKIIVIHVCLSLFSFITVLLLNKNDTASVLPSVRSFLVLLVALRRRMVCVLRRAAAPQGGGVPGLRRARHLRPGKQLSIHLFYLGSFRCAIMGALVVTFVCQISRGDNGELELVVHRVVQLKNGSFSPS
jgi:hypothetical protein